MKRKNVIIIIIMLATIIIGIINYERIQFFYYYFSSYSNNTKKIIENDYNFQEVTIVMQNKRNHLYEGIEKDTLRKKYIIKVSGKGVFTFYADAGVDISNVQIIAEDKGFPSTPINFHIKDSFSDDMDLKDCLYWYVINNKGEILYISFKDGVVAYSD